MGRARVTNRGQITLPRVVREQLGIEPGDSLELEMVGDHLTVRPVGGRSVAEMRRFAKSAAANGTDPSWAAPVAKSLLDLLQLPPGWNSYAARPISPRAVGTVLALLARTMRPETPVPSVIPMSRGDIQLEWHLRGMDIEVVVPAEGPVRVWYEDVGRGAERELTLAEDAEPLREILDALTGRP